MRFEWDETKNRVNRRKHEVSFELARRVFDDPRALSKIDSRRFDDERWVTLGCGGNRILFVAHTYHEEGDEEIIRIVSAREATSRERRAYREQG